MKKFTIIIIAALVIISSGCSQGSDNKYNFDVVSNNVTIWKDTTGLYSIVLAFEVSNLINDSLYFKESDFDIVDENGKLIDTMMSVSAYPPVVNPDKTAVYYDAKVSDKISDANIKLKAIPHIESEKSHVNLNGLIMTDSRVGGSLYSTGTVENDSFQEYKNVHIAIISRKVNNEVVSVMTAKIDSIKPHEQIEFKAIDCLKQRDLSPDVTNYQSFVYLNP